MGIPKRATSAIPWSALVRASGIGRLLLSVVNPKLNLRLNGYQVAPASNDTVSVSRAGMVARRKA